MNHEFQLTNADTDSIMIHKDQCSPFSREERTELLNEINELSPKGLVWEDDGYYTNVIILKAKNYILKNEDGKITYKGSALKSSKTEPALKEFLNKIIDSILTEKFNYTEIYNEFVNEILNVKDIKRWASKKSLTSTTYESERANETKIIDAIKGTEYKEGDRIFTYFDKEGNLKLVENYNNDHDIGRLLKKLHSTSKVFDAVIPKDTFINYSLKKNFKLLEESGSIKK